MLYKSFLAKQTCHFVIIYSRLTNNTKVLLHKKRIKKTEIELLQNVDMLYFCKKMMFYDEIGFVSSKGDEQKF